MRKHDQDLVLKCKFAKFIQETYYKAELHK
jgi:hypothetical protein